MALAAVRKSNIRLPPEVNRILYVRNLPFEISTEEMYDIFGKYGAIRQIRLSGDIRNPPFVCSGDFVDENINIYTDWLESRGCTAQTKGTAYVVYEDIFDAKNACEHLSGFNVCNRYLVVLYYQPHKAFKRVNKDLKRDQIDELKAKYGIDLDKK